MNPKSLLFALLLCFLAIHTSCQSPPPSLHYTIAIPQPESNTYQVALQSTGWDQDTLLLKMPNWMPGYYQLMHYAKNVENITAQDQNGQALPLQQTHENAWQLTGIKGKSFTVSYTVKTSRKFVATSYVDQEHAYLIPGSTFLYVDGFLHQPVSVEVAQKADWKDIATGLEPVPGKPDQFTAPNFDILYDCPILIGNLEELPSFNVQGIEHRFIGYKPGDFDRERFIGDLKKVVQASVDIIGDIPYKQYTFIAIGPGRGGIEHLNNTTVSFDGSGLNNPAAINRMLSFLAHEYFHHYNVKRIRPFELGPFDYDNGSRTNQLWVSEGLTVYYEYIILKRAGLIDTETFLDFMARQINTLEKDAGHLHQSVAQASYYTWEDGPFGGRGDGPDQSISVYNKGSVVGLLLDLAIRKATQNEKSLDDVMRKLYWHYYKQEKRGFTEAEIQRACEQIAGTALTEVFEYIYTTKELDYATYLDAVGLSLEKGEDDKLIIQAVEAPNALQKATLQSWLGN